MTAPEIAQEHKARSLMQAVLQARMATGRSGAARQLETCCRASWRRDLEASAMKCIIV
jgi:hypothetical protein